LAGIIIEITTSFSLQASGLAPAASLVLNATRPMIALIAAAAPPVSEFMTATQNAEKAARIDWM